MLIIGENINSSSKKILQALQEQDAAFLLNLAKEQVAAGANMIDINAAKRLEHEKGDLEWLVKVIQAEMEVPICLDCTEAEALEAGLKVHKGKAMINSVCKDRVRLETILPLAAQYKASVVALAMSEENIPSTVEERLQISLELIKTIREYGVPDTDIYIDPLVFPVAVDTDNAQKTLTLIREIKGTFPQVRTIIGLSNISYGLPKRDLINAVFLSIARYAGLDAALLNPFEKKVLTLLKATELLLGNDEYCRNYLVSYRKRELA
ncbi:MAG: dihydropteroate synthase [Firmicutes bacterium]|nr:dihydropteroate synthase [Bacillota bacterium]